MGSIQVWELKAQQGEYDDRKAKLLEAAQLFHEGFLTELEEFIPRAEEHGLRGIAPYKISQENDDFVEGSLKLAGFDVVLVQSRNVAKLLTASDVLATKLLVYLRDAEDARPWIEFVLHDSPPDSYGVSMMRASEQDGVELRRWDSMGKATGREAAEALLDFWDGHHPVRPTLVWPKHSRPPSLRMRGPQSGLACTFPKSRYSPPLRGTPKKCLLRLPTVIRREQAVVARSPFPRPPRKQNQQSRQLRPAVA